jgi:hypothetical protein
METNTVSEMSRHELRIDVAGCLRDFSEEHYFSQHSMNVIEAELDLRVWR